MCLSYKENIDYQNERAKIFETVFFDIEDETWDIQEDENLSECPDDLLQFVVEQSNILIDADADKEQRIQAILILSEQLGNFPACAKHISFSDDTLYSIMDIIHIEDVDADSNVDMSILASSVSLLKLLVLHLPITQNCINTNLVVSIDKCFDYPISFSIAADLIDILAILASSKEEQIFEQMKTHSVISRICDILSCININIAPSRERDRLTNLPFIESGINLEDEILISPLLVFIFHYFNWKDSNMYIVSLELMEHLFGIFIMPLSERNTCCCINTLMNVTVKKSYYLFKKTLQSLRIPIIDKIFEVATNSAPNSHIQRFAINTILNISLNTDDYFLLEDKYFNAIYQLIKANEINDHLKEQLILIIECNSYDACRYKGNKIKGILPSHIVDTFKLHFLEELFCDTTFIIKSHIGGIFINLLEKRQYQDTILSEINVFNILLPLFHTENAKCICLICNFFQNLIETETDEKNRDYFCKLINDEQILNGLDDIGDDKDAYLAAAQLQNIIDQYFVRE